MEDALEPAAQRFERLAEPFRRELQVHCYRMLGSIHEAEDAVQETYLRAWSSYDAYEDRGSLRAWLYRIATNACLNVLASRKRASRLLPNQHSPPAVHMPAGDLQREVLWLEPFPDARLEAIVDETPGPEARYAAREAVQLAFIAAIQQLPPRQRAVLLLRDVIGWSAAEAAHLLGGSVASINSALQRARATLASRYPAGSPAAPSPATAEQQHLLGRYVNAWEQLDVDGLVALLKEDATYTMPPVPEWYAGRGSIGRFFESAWKSYDGFRMRATFANGQPAFAAYARNRAGEPWTAHSIHVLSLDADMISDLTLFLARGDARLFPAFGLPLVLPDQR